MLLYLVLAARFEISAVMAGLPVAIPVIDDDAIEMHGHDGSQQCQVVIR